VEVTVMRDMQQFLQWRAETLAGMILTRRDDLVVRWMDLPSGATDFLVDVVCGRESPGHVFGVRVKGLEHAVGSPDEVPVQLSNLPLDDLSDAPMPYGIVVCTSDDERGYFRWVREPVSTRRGARLKTVHEARWRELDHDSMADIVAAVNAWYDAQRQAQAA
jgi:hypothetical protein